MPDRIDIVALDHLMASARNARTHSDQQIAALAAT